MMSIRLSELEGLTSEEIAERMSAFMDASFAPPNGSVAPLEEKIRNFEARYDMTSEEVIKGIETGQIKETEEIAEWAIDYSLLKDLSKVPAQNRG